MPSETLNVPLVPSPMGTHRWLRVVRFGDTAARPKAYIHAGLHADETPGMLVTAHLLRRLEAAEAHGEITGQIVVIPYANPIGLSQFINGEHLGRHDLISGGNFNRGWPDLASRIAERIDGALGTDGDQNTAIIRDAMHSVLAEYPVVREVDALRLALVREACDADLVLDLHCDDESLAHMFLMTPHWPQLASLAAELGCSAALLADDAGGMTFAASMYSPWSALAARFPDHDVPLACNAATVEHRGYADVDDELADADAGALFRALQRQGCLHGDPGPPAQPACRATPLDACDIVRAPVAGIVVYRAALGEQVSRGDVLAEVLDLASARPDGDRRLVHAAADGIVLSRRLRKLVAAGEVIAKVAGSEPLAHRQGYLLED